MQNFPDNAVASDEVVKVKTVEEWLNGVSYEEDVDYVPGEFALLFVNFIKMVNGGEGEENKTPVLHFRMLDQVAGKETNIANMVHRGAAKTTVLGEYLFLYIATYGGIPEFGRVPLAIYVSDSIDNGVKNMRKNLEFRWEESEFLRKYVPHTKFTDTRWEFMNVDGQKFIVKGYGAKTGVRGAKEMGKRPYLAVLDDLISDEDARSPTVIASIEDTVYKAIDYALHPTHYKIIWSGTPFNAKDPLYKAVESGAWKVNVYPVCEKFPCSRAEFKGSWPERFTYDYVNNKYRKAVKAGKIDTFNQELMLRIMSDEDRMIEDSDIRWYRRKDLIANQSSFNFYITTDFATSEKTASDYSVIIVWALNAQGEWFLVDGICKRQLMDKNVNDLFKLVQKYKPMNVGIEVTGQQKGFVSWVQSEMMKRNIWFTMATANNSKEPGIRPNTNKMERFNVVVPWIKSGRVKFPKEMEQTELMVEIVNELSLATPKGFKSKHDDAIDNISMLPLLGAWEPSESAGDWSKQEDDMWAIDADDDETTSSLDSYIV